LAEGELARGENTSENEQPNLQPDAHLSNPHIFQKKNTPLARVRNLSIADANGKAPTRA